MSRLTRKRLGSGTSRLVVALWLLGYGHAVANDKVNSTEDETGPIIKRSLLDRFHDGFADSVDGSARWVDGFFGKKHTDEETTGAYGRFRLRAIWKEYEGIKVRTRLRAELPLTNISKRVNAVFGRGDTDSVVSGTDENDYLLSSEDDDDWLAGLGYTPPWSRSKRVSIGAGVKLDIPLNPYARITYRVKHDFDEKSLIKGSQSLFWERDEGWGSTTTLDLEHKFNEQYLIRWANWGKFSEASFGLEYDSRIELYQHLGPKRAILYTLELNGESDRPVPVREYGGYFIYRQQAFRDWLYGEIILGMSQLRQDEWTERRSSLIIGLGFEMVFKHSNDEYNTASTRHALLHR